MARVCTLQPDIVGLSIIFQNLAGDFQELARALRAAGSPAHITVGGHYPSFAFDALLASTPQLDSVVRFEGEDTIVDLAGAIASGLEWRTIPGLAFRNHHDEVVCSPMRHGRRRLDGLPWPDREGLPAPAGPLPTASLLGSRGCPQSCAFCSISQFYRENATPGRRLRDPVDVVDEMEWLHRRGAQVLLFQDDDFLGGGPRGVRWAHAIAGELVRRELSAQVRWRISCRSDEVTEDTLQPLIAGGLAHVYLGVESGDAGHLDDLGKRETAQDHLAAVRVLQRLGLSFDFGFMLMTPWSDFDSMLRNLAFFEELVEGGASAVGFCRTLPYAGTRIADRLRAEGRLSPGCDADYRFIDPRLDALWEWLYITFNERNHDPSGTRNLLGMLLFEAQLGLPGHRLNGDHQRRLRALTQWSNASLVDIVRTAIQHASEHSRPLAPDDTTLRWLADQHRNVDAEIREHLTWVCRQRIAANALEVPEADQRIRQR